MTANTIMLPMYAPTAVRRCKGISQFKKYTYREAGTVLTEKFKNEKRKIAETAGK